MTYRWIEHTAELELEIDAPTEEAVFADALAAFSELVGPASGAATRRQIQVRGADRAVRLADWLEELVFLAETEGFVPERVASLDVGETFVRADVEGRIAAPPHLVKAVTYHRLELAPDNGGWRGRVVLDV